MAVLTDGRRDPRRISFPRSRHQNRYRGIERGLDTRGLITEVDSSLVRTHLIVKTETQVLKVRLLDGPHEGEEIAITNLVTGRMEFDEFHEPGSVVLVGYNVVDRQPSHGLACGYYRLHL